MCMWQRFVYTFPLLYFWPMKKSFMSTFSAPHVPQPIFFLPFGLFNYGHRETKANQIAKDQKISISHGKLTNRFESCKILCLWDTRTERESRVCFQLKLDFLSARIISGFCHSFYFDICRPCFLLLITSPSFPPTHSNTKTRYQIKALEKKIKTCLKVFGASDSVHGCQASFHSKRVECRLYIFRFGKRALLDCLHLKPNGHPSSAQVRCMLNIWGVMLFIRMTWIVGQAGIGRFRCLCAAHVN